MQTITIVTGNPGKLAQYKTLLPKDYILQSVDHDLPEIQSLDLDEIVSDKAKRAYEITGSPVLVDDTSAELEKLHGLPGPFIKFFEQKLGNDALYQLANSEHAKATVKCRVAYYDGQHLVIGKAQVVGTTVSPRGNNGFGFDRCFLPDGYTETYAEMSPHTKNAMSHRFLALNDLVSQLNKLK